MAGKHYKKSALRWIRIGAPLVVLLLCMGAYWLGFSIFDQEPMAKEAQAVEKEVTIQKDMSVGDVGRLLKKEGLISSIFIFRIQESLSDYKGKMKPGVHKLSTGQTVDEMLAVLAQNPEKGSK